jgi:alkylated DNA nucleotide flippase Atl1
MASIRAEAVAELLWELKRMERLATFTEVAERAGFKPGVGAKNILICLDTVRRDWPHLQWWRVVQDNGHVATNSPHAKLLSENGYVLDQVSGAAGFVQLAELETHLHSWTAAAGAPSDTAIV